MLRGREAPGFRQSGCSAATEVYKGQIEWEIEAGETVSAWVIIFGPNGENIATKIIEQTSDGIGFIIQDKGVLSPGLYSAEVHVKDNSGNEVETTLVLVDIPVPLPVIGSNNVSLALEGEELLLSGNVTFRSGAGTLNWVVNEELWLVVPIQNGALSEHLTLSNLSNSSHNITLQICSLDQCENYTQMIDATPWWNL